MVKRSSRPVHAEPDSTLLDIDGLARRLGVTTRFVRRLVLERRIPFLKVGYFVRFDPAEVEAWLDQARVAQEHQC